MAVAKQLGVKQLTVATLVYDVPEFLHHLIPEVETGTGAFSEQRSAKHWRKSKYQAPRNKTM